MTRPFAFSRTAARSCSLSPAPAPSAAPPRTRAGRPWKPRGNAWGIRGNAWRVENAWECVGMRLGMCGSAWECVGMRRMRGSHCECVGTRGSAWEVGNLPGPIKSNPLAAGGGAASGERRGRRTRPRDVGASLTARGEHTAVTHRQHGPGDRCTLGRRPLWLWR
jgi:hypothetical protein